MKPFLLGYSKPYDTKLEGDVDVIAIAFFGLLERDMPVHTPQFADGLRFRLDILRGDRHGHGLAAAPGFDDGTIPAARSRDLAHGELIVEFYEGGRSPVEPVFAGVRDGVVGPDDAGIRPLSLDEADAESADAETQPYLKGTLLTIHSGPKLGN